MKLTDEKKQQAMFTALDDTYTNAAPSDAAIVLNALRAQGLDIVKVGPECDVMCANHGDCDTYYFEQKRSDERQE